MEPSRKVPSRTRGTALFRARRPARRPPPHKGEARALCLPYRREDRPMMRVSRRLRKWTATILDLPQDVAAGLAARHDDRGPSGNGGEPPGNSPLLPAELETGHGRRGNGSDGTGLDDPQHRGGGSIRRREDHGRTIAR